MSFNVGIMMYNFPCLCDFLHEMEASFFFFFFPSPLCQSFKVP